MHPGGKIKEERLRRGLTQSELSWLTGITIRSIQRIENNEVNPSLHSLKTIGEALQTDLLEGGYVPETGAPEPQRTIKTMDMNQFMEDLKALFKKHWKFMLGIALLVWLATNYTDIKQGIADAWGGK